MGVRIFIALTKAGLMDFAVNIIEDCFGMGAHIDIKFLNLQNILMMDALCEKGTLLYFVKENI